MVVLGVILRQITLYAEENCWHVIEEIDRFHGGSMMASGRISHDDKTDLVVMRGNSKTDRCRGCM